VIPVKGKKISTGSNLKLVATDVWTKIDEFEIKVLVLVMMNMILDFSHRSLR
jgi:hypothetical protein